MTPTHARPTQQLARLLDLPHPPVAVTFVQAGDEPAAPAPEPIPAQPAGCCFWEPAQRRTLDTRAENHANCSVGSYTHGSYTHGLIPLPRPTADRRDRPGRRRARRQRLGHRNRPRCRDRPHRGNQRVAKLLVGVPDVNAVYPTGAWDERHRVGAH